MIYDTLISICTLSVGTPLQGTLSVRERVYGAELEVYSRRYWDSVAAGSSVDRLYQIPLHRDINGGDYAVITEYGEKRVYRIEQAQRGKDENELPVTTISMRRPEGHYDIAAV